MKKSDEFIRLEEKYRKLKESGKITGEVLELTEDMFGVLNKDEARLNEIEDRLLKLEDFSDILSMDLYDIQTALLQGSENGEISARLGEFDDFSDDDDDFDPFSAMHEESCSCEDHDHCDGNCHCHEHDHDHCGENCHCHDHDDDEENDDDENTTFIRCPFCNTLIFVNGKEEEDKEISCPFCGESFLKSDVSF